MKKIEQNTQASVHVPLEIRTISPRNRKSKHPIEIARPLYAGYVFIELNGEPWQQIVRLPYMTGVLKHGTTPYMISKASVSVDIVVPAEVEDHFPVGSCVKITHGPFMNCVGFVDEQLRVELLAFNRLVKVKLPKSMLIKIGP